MKNKLKNFLFIILVCSCVFIPACSFLSAPINEAALNIKNISGGLPTDEAENDDWILNAPDEEDNLENIVTPPETADSEKYILVKTNGLSVRSGAGTQYSSICSFNSGDMLGYYGTENGWYVTMARGVKGYVSANSKYTGLFGLQKGNESVENVIGVAKKYLGTPYVYGAVRYHNGNGVLLSGFSTNAFDCSSFMQYAFYIGNGDLLGLTTRNQVLQGTKVEKSEIRRGDLLFFTNASRYNNTGLERVGHVALYLGGNYILHTASDYAVIEQISSARWSYYIEARRIAD